MSGINSEDILFIGRGHTPSSWYRCGLPANYLGCDWIGINKGPPGVGVFLCGNIPEIPDPTQYKLIIAQMPYGEDWEQKIKNWKKLGIKIIFECDDFLHGVRKIDRHPHKNAYGRKQLKSYERCMGLADALICSTEFLASRYKKYNSKIFVCPIGVETRLYDIELPKRDHIALGWAGGAGHNIAMSNWMQEISQIMISYKTTSFVTIGVDYANLYEEFFPNRTLSVPWVSIENFPYALTNFDINLAPAHESYYYLSKSELRYIQASALGIPSIVDPRIYRSAKHKLDAMVAETPEDIIGHAGTLIRNESIRKEMGAVAQQHARDKHDASITSEEWIQVFEGVW
jgi:glycosyltransferase involved in cell wall biosynthesis